jgi:hypothetical protein
MFSPIFFTHTPITGTAGIVPGNVLFRSSENSHLYGIYVGNQQIVIQRTPASLEETGCDVQAVRLSDFVSGAEILRCEIGESFDNHEAVRRAKSAIGKEISDNVFSCLGDDFVYWSLTESRISPEADGSSTQSIFGDHLSVPFQDTTHMIKAVHHGIGIENLCVIHFSDITSERKSLDWKKAIRLTPFSEFSDNREVTRYTSKDMDTQWHINARNRAMNALFSGQYDKYSLWFKNCEHLATWCATGHKSSEQIQNIASAIGLIAITGVSLLARKPHPVGLIKGLQKVKKHFKWPWKDL